ncbi:Heat stress transcription factor A-1a [Cardamine amara subsp. amara]|uniref:Heat stress transcription factor A-1a n=1 Tax=Cardamine amara subsp. amara TaxID=228776 RepID=A0ABD1C5M7_CARAN
MDGENNNHGATASIRNEVFEFLHKAYSMVNDPSTDSIISWGPNGNSFIVWNPLECCRNLLPRLLEINDFSIFQTYGFRKVESGRQFEFACIDFVRGQPQLLDKIVERYLKMLKDITAVDHFRNHTIPELRNLTVHRYNQDKNIENFQTGNNILNRVENLLSRWKMVVEPDGSNIFSLLHNFHLSSL